MTKTNKKCIIDLGKIRIERRIWINEDSIEYVKVYKHWFKLETFRILSIEETE